MSEHTPGPWVAHCDDPRSKNGMALVVAHKGRGTMSIDATRSGASFAEDCANARLIAAAPDLLAALREIVRAEWTTVSLQGMTPQHRARLESARAAIAKAEADHEPS
jgi:hypothetical protein